MEKVGGFSRKDGYYWYITPSIDPVIVMIKHGLVWAIGALEGGPITALDRGEWYGPLEPPRVAQALLASSDRARVNCDQQCESFDSPETLDEYKAALEHWMGHSCSAGCSHAR